MEHFCCGEKVKKRWFDLSVLIFLALLSMFFVSGLILFWLKTGLTVEGIQRAYRPDIFDPHASPSSFEGVLKVATPHFFAMALVWFVLCHFLMFLSSVASGRRRQLVRVSGFSVVCYNLCPFLIALHSVNWAWLSMLSFIVFQSSFILMTYIVWKDASVDLSKSIQFSRS